MAAHSEQESYLLALCHVAQVRRRPRLMAQGSPIEWTEATWDQRRLAIEPPPPLCRSRRSLRCRRRRRARSGTRGGHVRYLHHLNLDVDLDLLAHEHAARLEHLVPAQAEVAAVDAALETESEALIAPRILAGAARRRFERHLARRSVKRQVAGDLVDAVAGCLDALAGECELRELLRVEEVRRAQVIVSLWLAGVDARDLDLRLDLRARGVLRVVFDLARPGLELAAHLGKDHVASREADFRVRGVDVVFRHVSSLVTQSIGLRLLPEKR